MASSAHRRGVADVPRADHVEPAEGPGPLGVLLISPVPRAAADQRDPVSPVRLEEVDDAVGRGRGEAVAEEAPDEQDRLAVVVQVAGVLRHLQLVHQPLPVPDQRVVDPVLGEVGHVVADGVDPARRPGRVPDVAEHPIERRVADVHEEPLDEHAVDAVLLHPAEVALDGQRVGRAEQVGLRAVGMGEAGGRVRLVGGGLGHVRPHLEGQGLRRDPRRAAAPVPPALARRVARTAEPALIPAEHLVPQGRGVDHRRWAGGAGNVAAGDGCRPGEEQAGPDRPQASSHGFHLRCTLTSVPSRPTPADG